MFTANPKMTEDKIVNDLKNLFGKEFTYADVKGYCRSHGVSESTVMKRIGKYRVGKGRYNLEVKVREVVEKIEKAYEASPAAPAVNLVPGKDDRFVSFGNFPTLKKIIKSGIFYPSFITGLSGNGKTLGVEQTCAALNRELIRVNITIETD